MSGKRALQARPFSAEAPAEPILPQRGGTLRVAIDADPTTWRPGRGDPTTDRLLAPLLYETILDCRGGEPAASVADRWEWSGDRSRLSLHVRADRLFHDGRPMDARDVAATIEAEIAPPSSGGPSARIELAGVAGVEIPDLRTVRLRLRHPSAMVLRSLCEVYALPGEDVRGAHAGRWAAVGRLPVGTGPFRVAGWDRGKRIRLVPAAQRWPDRYAETFVDEIVFEIESDPAKALARTRRGQIDLLPRVSDAHIPDDVDPLALRGVADLRLAEPERWSFLVVNHRSPALRDARVRQALSLLWNRGRFAQELHRGLARPLGGPPYGTAPPPPFDPNKARELLDAAGWRPNDDGVRARAGEALRIQAIVPRDSRTASVEMRALAIELRALGGGLDIIELDADQAGAEGFMGRLQSGRFDLAPSLWSGRADDDPGLLFESGGPFNFGRYESAVVNGLLTELRAVPSLAGRRSVRERIGNALAGDCAGIFLYRHDVAVLVGARVHGLRADGDRLDLRQVWLIRN